jgi:hypothetical protein
MMPSLHGFESPMKKPLTFKWDERISGYNTGWDTRWEKRLH